jgi:hypothetical protein
MLIKSGTAGCAILLTRALISPDSVTARLNRGWGIPRSGNISVPRDFYVWSDKAKVPQNVPPSSNLAMIFMMVQAINARTFPKLGRCRPKSGPGQSRHFWPVRRMSAYPLTAAE